VRVGGIRNEKGNKKEKENINETNKNKRKKKLNGNLSLKGKIYTKGAKIKGKNERAECFLELIHTE
jgi:hypothetical protein